MRVQTPLAGFMTSVRLAGALIASLLAVQCTSQPERGRPAPPASDLTPILSIKELMEDIIDPQADFVFDAVGVDVGPKGAVETRPTTDEDWVKVKRGALELTEGSNLLKMPRRAAPPGDRSVGGAGQPELSSEEVEAKIEKDRALWNSHADKLRDEALKVLEIVKAKDAGRLFEAGSAIDSACEACHLEYWYPGDKAAVERQKSSTTYVQKPPAAP